jgi:hypothetical protein
MFPVFTFLILAGVVGSECDDSDIWLKIKNFGEVSCFKKGAVGFLKEA